MFGNTDEISAGCDVVKGTVIEGRQWPQAGHLGLEKIWRVVPDEDTLEA